MFMMMTIMMMNKIFKVFCYRQSHVKCQKLPDRSVYSVVVSLNLILEREGIFNFELA